MPQSDASSESETGTLVAHGFRRGRSGFEAQIDAFLHRRLRLSAILIGVAALIMFLNAMITHVVSGLYRERGLLDFSRLTILGGVVVAFLFVAVLSKRGLTRGWLSAIDAGLAGFVILACVVFYHGAWKNGPTFVVPILGLFILARSIFVPSRPLRTFWLSVPAIPAILAVQLYHGEFYADIDLRHADHSFTTLIAWNQLVLIISVGLSTVASRVSFSLRRKVYEATELGQYKLEALIGEGGMGEVYRARHAMMRRPTAVKVIRASMLDEKTISRFEREVQQTARLTHPNTIAVYDYGLTPEGTFFYAMELLDGEDLKAIVKSEGPMPPSRVIHILAQACGALHEAHVKGLVHRDIKAGNLILCERGLQHDVVKVVDFGLVKDTRDTDSGLTDVGQVCGTPETIAPETLRGQETCPSSDIYALGAVGCYLLTGRPVFEAQTVFALLAMHLNDAPVPPSERGAEVPEDLERVLLSCLAKDPEDRPASAAALRAALLECDAAGEWTEQDAARWWRDRRGSC